MRTSKIKLITPFLLVGIASGLDVSLEKATCDASLPVTADIYMKCANGARCSFGDSVNVYGTFHFNNVENSGIQNNQAYLSANLELWTLDFTLFDMLPVPLCHDTMVASSSNENACPGNGAYDFSVNYTLPKAGNFSWLASGWAGEGLIQMFAEVDETMKIGECGLGLETYVTRKESNTSILEFPSAAVSSGLFLALFAVFMILCCYCYVCRRGRAISTEKPADEISYFSKMEDDAKSTRSRASSKKTKKTDASVVSDLI